MTTSWRMFCAVELPPEVRARLQDHVARLRRDVPDVAASWTRVENIHLTLKFFGDVAVGRIETISGALNRAMKDVSSFEISVGKTGAFRTQVLWIGVSDPSGRLTALHDRIESECVKEGFEKEDRAYRPHLTIARIRRSHGERRLVDAHLKTEFELIRIDLRELILFRSELSPKGSQYTAISNHGLNG
ncbi:MAG TPA: RNA 2',3'-cyclic phosphodiesterase [Pyrinomonadaceae bacterium]